MMSRTNRRRKGDFEPLERRVGGRRPQSQQRREGPRPIVDQFTLERQRVKALAREMSDARNVEAMEVQQEWNRVNYLLRQPHVPALKLREPEQPKWDRERRAHPRPTFTQPLTYKAFEVLKGEES